MFPRASDNSTENQRDCPNNIAEVTNA